ncbi:hypothetical protein ACTVZO_16935 [Streptomyces sp. IBSNAI002]
MTAAKHRREVTTAKHRREVTTAKHRRDPYEPPAAPRPGGAV